MTTSTLPFSNKSAFIQRDIGKFLEGMSSRMEDGEKEYGKDKFLDLKLLDEMQQELIDVANYAFFQYIKLENMKKRGAR